MGRSASVTRTTKETSIEVTRRPRRDRARRRADAPALPVAHGRAARPPRADRPDGAGHGRRGDRRPPHDRGPGAGHRPVRGEGARRQGRDLPLRLGHAADGRGAGHVRARPVGARALRLGRSRCPRGPRLAPGTSSSRRCSSRRSPAGRSATCTWSSTAGRSCTTSSRSASRPWRARCARPCAIEPRVDGRPVDQGRPGRLSRRGRKVGPGARAVARCPACSTAA